uniref:C2 domain-containing protein n=1 Tax=Davidia involucrata TaxID=16924 RepID=A0A5B7C9V4_DAVIN
MPSSIKKPFQLLEINIISAQDLEPVSRNVRTYATAWVHRNRKLTTRVDTEGRTNPTWNDKFVFRVDEEFLRSDTASVMIEIYALHWFRDTQVGTVRVLVGNLIPPPARPHHHYHLGMRFVALQVRRPSGRPQGILNIGVALLDSSMRSMPLYTQLSASAVGFRDLMGEEDPHNHHHHNNNHNTTTTNNYYNNNNPPIVKPILRRSKSERSERVTFDDLSTTNGSMVGVPQKNVGQGKASSIISGSSMDTPKSKRKKEKASSVISGAEFRERPNKNKGKKKGKASSLISGGSEPKTQPKDKLKNEKPDLINKDFKAKVTQENLASELSDSSQIDKPATKINGSGVKPVPTPKGTIGKPISKFNGYEFGPSKGSLVNGKFIFGGPAKANSIWSDSEVGPSPSEVAAAMAAERYPLDENRSSVLDGWSLDESVEGLRSKLERWRTELPPLYDRGFSSSSFRSTSQHLRRHTDGGGGLFSCFGNVYGYECQCICGKPPEKRGLNSRGHSPSASAGRSFL